MQSYTLFFTWSLLGRFIVPYFSLGLAQCGLITLMMQIFYGSVQFDQETNSPAMQFAELFIIFFRCLGIIFLAYTINRYFA